jgi:hypothetical protein
MTEPQPELLGVAEQNPAVKKLNISQKKRPDRFLEPDVP